MGEAIMDQLLQIAVTRPEGGVTAADRSRSKDGFDRHLRNVGSQQAAEARPRKPTARQQTQESRSRPLVETTERTNPETSPNEKTPPTGDGVADVSAETSAVHSSDNSLQSDPREEQSHNDAILGVAADAAPDVNVVAMTDVLGSETTTDIADFSVTVQPNSGAHESTHQTPQEGQPLTKNPNSTGAMEFFDPTIQNQEIASPNSNEATVELVASPTPAKAAQIIEEHAPTEIPENGITISQNAAKAAQPSVVAEPKVRHNDKLSGGEHSLVAPAEQTEIGRQEDSPYAVASDETQRNSSSAANTSSTTNIDSPRDPLATEAQPAPVSDLPSSHTPVESSDNTAATEPTAESSQRPPTTDTSRTDGLLNSLTRLQRAAPAASNHHNSGSEIPSVDPARFVNRVAKAFHAAQDRQGPLQLRLSPPELGSLRLELTIKDGALTAALETESPAAKKVLLEHLPALRDRLAEQNIRIERFDVDVRRDGAGQHMAGFDERQHQQEMDDRPPRPPHRPSAPQPRTDQPIQTNLPRVQSESALNLVV